MSQISDNSLRAAFFVKLDKEIAENKLKMLLQGRHVKDQDIFTTMDVKKKRP